MIRNSLEWAQLSSNLQHTVGSKIGIKPNRQQAYKMISNIGTEIILLSKAEVLARRGIKSPASELLEKINTDIKMVEEFILVAALLG